MRFFRLLCLVLSLSLTAPTPFALAQKRSKRRAAKRAQVYKPKVVPMLTMEEISRLEYWQTVRYVSLIKESLLEAAKIQTSAERGYVTKHFPFGNRDIWALLLGNTADADDIATARMRAITANTMAEAANEAQAKIDDLEKELASAKTEREKQRISNEIARQKGIQKAAIASRNKYAAKARQSIESARSEKLTTPPVRSRSTSLGPTARTHEAVADQLYQEHLAAIKKAEELAQKEQQATSAQEKASLTRQIAETQKIAGDKLRAHEAAKKKAALATLQHTSRNTRVMQKSAGSSNSTANTGSSGPSAEASNRVRETAVSSSSVVQKVLELRQSQGVDGSNDHKRGDSPQDRCIYGLELSSYKKKGNAFSCVNKAQSCKTSANEPGYYCGFFGSGLNKDNGCYPAHQKYSSSVVCAKMAAKVKSDNAAVIEKFLGEYPTTASKEERYKHIDELMKYAADERVFAHLLKLAADYRTSLPDGHKMPGKLGEYFDKPDSHLPKLGQNEKENYDNLSQYVDEYFFGFVSHCNQPLDPSVAAGIEDNAKNLKSQWHKKVETMRYNFMKQALKRGEVPTVGNSLKKPQCDRVKKRVALISDELRDIRATLPDRTLASSPTPAPDISQGIRDTRGETTEHRRTVQPVSGSKGVAPRTPVQKAPKSEKAMPKEIAKFIDNNSFGCRPTRAHDYQPSLDQRSMACMACAAEKDVLNHNGNPKYATSGVSKKWLTLLSVMTHVCGDSKNRIIDMDTAMNYVKAYGHCSAKDYNWDNTKFMKGDRELLESWQLGQNLGEMDKKKNAKFFGLIGDGNMKRLFGMSRDQLETRFCTGKSARGKLKQSEQAYWHERRQLLESRQPMVGDAYGDGEPKEASQIAEKENMSADLVTCMSNSYKNAEMLYSTSNSVAGGSCESLKPIAPLGGKRPLDKSDFIYKHKTQTKTRPVILVTDKPGNECYVSKSYGTARYPSGRQEDVLTFTSPNFTDSESNGAIHLSLDNGRVIEGPDVGERIRLSKISVKSLNACPNPDARSRRSSKPSRGTK